MPNQYHSQSRDSWGAESRLFIVYCRTCNLLFGKTISVMAGEAREQERWCGQLLCVAIDWVLRDPNHCAQELGKFNTFLKHKRFLLSAPE